MHSIKSNQKQKVNSPTQFNFEAIGTQWIIDIYNEVSQQQRDEMLRKVTIRIEEFDKTYSRFRDDSLVHQISKQAGIYTFPDDFSELISLYKKMYELTDGLMTPLIGNVLEDAGYDKDYSFEQKEIESIKRWEDVIEIKNNTLIVSKPVTLDFGAIGKGYLIDLVGEVLEENNIDSYCIDAGGDLLIKNMDMKVGFEHPEDPKQVIGVQYIQNGSICGSAGNRRKWGNNLHHIFNPKTLQPVSTIKAVWVSAKTALIADALTTALFFVEPEKLKEFEFEYLIINEDYSFKSSQDFPSELYVS